MEVAETPLGAPKSMSIATKTGAATLVALFSIALAWPRIGNRTASTQLSDAQVKAVVLAVEDEVYDFGYEKHFDLVGPAPRPGVTRLPVYITPTLHDGEGKVIYKLMPYGEVIRGFHFGKRGLAVLEGAPDSGFRPTEPNLLTVYLDDDDVCRWKHEWLRRYFEIMDVPPRELVKEAGERQKQRVGYSAQEVPPASQRKLQPHPQRRD